MSAAVTGPAKLNRLRLAGKPFASLALTLSDEGKESMRAQTPPNDQPADPVSNVEQAIEALNVRHFFKQDCRVEISIDHCPTPPRSNTTERVWVGPQFFFRRNEPLAVIDEPIAGARRAAEPFRINTLMAAPLSASRLSHNDNWHPLEAA